MNDLQEAQEILHQALVKIVKLSPRFRHHPEYFLTLLLIAYSRILVEYSKNRTIEQIIKGSTEMLATLLREDWERKERLH